MTFDAVERIADAVLYEGYVLYPYRASAAKNQFRWQFGVVAPRPPREDGEPWFTQTECIVVVDRSQSTVHSSQFTVDSSQFSVLGSQLFIRVRCLRPEPNASGWLEGVQHAIDLGPIALEPLPVNRTLPVDLGVDAALLVDAERAGGYIKLRLRLENREPWHDAFAASRDAMLARSMVGTHLLLAIEHGRFVSLLDPPPAAAALAAACENRHTWPVLVGDRARHTLMLSSPIVLYDFPAVARESPGDLCDAAEIDEILSLRIMTMTDEEKREARETDPRARAILDRVEAMAPDALAALHGAVRSPDFFNPPDAAPDEAFVLIGDRRVSRGSKVRLRPSRRADAMDMFLKDQRATVAGVYRDVDDRVYVAVTVDADPAASLHESFGRFFYFDPTEVEPLDLEQERV